MACQPKTLRRCVVKGFEAAYTWKETKDPSDLSARRPENPYDWYSDRWFAWQRGYRMGSALAWVERQDAADKAANRVPDNYTLDARAQRKAREIVNDTNPQLVMRFE